MTVLFPLSRGAGKCGEDRGFLNFPRGDWGCAPSRGAGECRGSPAASKPPFVVGSNCAIFGTPCGGGHPSYRSVAPLHTVAALRFPAPSGPPIAPLPRNRLAFSAAGGASPVSPSYSPCKKELFSFRQGFSTSWRAVRMDSPQPVEKVQHSWAFSHLYGKISMGDERCLNEGSWIVES